MLYEISWGKGEKHLDMAAFYSNPRPIDTQKRIIKRALKGLESKSHKSLDNNNSTESWAIFVNLEVQTNFLSEMLSIVHGWIWYENCPKSRKSCLGQNRWLSLFMEVRRLFSLMTFSGRNQVVIGAGVPASEELAILRRDQQHVPTVYDFVKDKIRNEVNQDNVKRSQWTWSTLELVSEPIV